MKNEDHKQNQVGLKTYQIVWITIVLTLSIAGFMSTLFVSGPASEELASGEYSFLFYTINDDCPEIKKEVQKWIKTNKMITVGKRKSINHQCEQVRSNRIKKEFLEQKSE